MTHFKAFDVFAPLQTDAKVKQTVRGKELIHDDRPKRITDKTGFNEMLEIVESKRKK